MDNSNAQYCNQENEEQSGFDPDEAAEMLGLTIKQKIFCGAKLKGASQSKAAEVAGYQGSPAYLRSIGSKLMRVQKIQAYMSWAMRGGAGVPDDPVDDSELLRLLSRHARGANGSLSVRASEAISRLRERDRAAQERKAGEAACDPTKALRDLFDLSPLIGAMLARKVGLPVPNDAIPSEARWHEIYDELFRQRTAVEPIALQITGTPGERARKAHIIETNTRRPEDDSRNVPDGWDAPTARRTREGIMPDALTNDFRQGGPGELNPFANGTNSRRSKLK